MLINEISVESMTVFQRLKKIPYKDLILNQEYTATQSTLVSIDKKGKLIFPFRCKDISTKSPKGFMVWVEKTRKEKT